MMELFLLDPRKWVEFLLHPKEFFSKKVKIDFRYLFLEVFIASLISAVLFVFLEFLNGNLESTFMYAIAQKTGIGFLNVLVYGVLAFLMARLLKGNVDFAKNTYSMALPLVISWLIVIFSEIVVFSGNLKTLFDLIFMLGLFAYAIAGLKYVNKYSWLKAVAIFFITFFVSGLII